MNFDLNKWNPFRFLRKTPDEKRAAPPPGPGTQPTPGAPPSSNAPGGWLADPLHHVADWIRDPFDSLGHLDRWFGDFSPSRFHPRVDVVDDGDALRVVAEVPGMDSNDIKLEVSEGVLALSGEKRLETSTSEQGCYRLERAFGHFQRMIPLPAGLDTDRAEASFDKGTLMVRIPKSGQPEPGMRRIEIK